jgi:hypothetical protein
MPGDTQSSGDAIFDSEENLEAEKEESGRQPLFLSPDDSAAAWLEQDREGNYYLSIQLSFLGQSWNFPMFVNDEREKGNQIMNKAGSVLTE